MATTFNKTQVYIRNTDMGEWRFFIDQIDIDPIFTNLKKKRVKDGTIYYEINPGTVIMFLIKKYNERRRVKLGYGQTDSITHQEEN